MVLLRVSIVLVLSGLTCAFGGPPRITEAPSDLRVLEDGAAIFICRAEGQPEPRIFWRKKGQELNDRRLEDHGRHSLTSLVTQSGVRGSVLTLRFLNQDTDEGEYECVAENGVGDPVSATATLRILKEEDAGPGFPRINLHPKTTAVEIGRDAIFYCRSTGNPSPKISWFRNSVPIDLSDPRYTLLHEGHLQIYQTSEADDGDYECQARNSRGVAVSKPAQLYVKERRVPAKFTIHPKRLYEVQPGHSLNITCVAIGHPMPKVWWVSNPVGSGIVQRKETAPVGKNVLYLKDIQSSVNYTCLASNKHLTVEAPTTIIVESPPKAPVNLSYSEITASTLHLQWSYPGEDEDWTEFVILYRPKQANQPPQSITGISTKFYTIRQLSPFTEYEFRVVAHNHIGRGSPSKPLFASTGEAVPSSAPRNVHARPLSSSTMIVRWDAPLMPNGRITAYKVYYTTHPSAPLHAWQSQRVDTNTLTTISSLTPRETYVVRIQSHTAVGPGPLSDPVQVKMQQGVPSQPNNFRVRDRTSTSITLEWDMPSHAGESVISYELYWNDTYSNTLSDKSLPSIPTSYKLSNLYPNNVYTMWIAAKSRQGEGASTAPMEVKTEEFVPGAPPQDVRVFPEGPRALRVSWAPPPTRHANGEILYYKIGHLQTNLPESEAVETKITNPSARDWLLDELDRWTEYKVWVLAGTVVGDGPPSKAKIVRTDEDVPGPPTELDAEVLNATAIRVTWNPPAEENMNGVIVGYQIHIQTLDKRSRLKGSPKLFQISDPTSNSFTVGDLEPETQYQIQMGALTRKGDGIRTAFITRETKGGVPSRPPMTMRLLQTPTSSIQTTASIQITWEEPQQTFGDILGWRLRVRSKVNASDVPIEDEDNIPFNDILVDDASARSHVLSDRAMGVEYEIRLSALNREGYGQETVSFISTPEGVPSGPPTSIEHHFVTPDILVVSWKPPLPEQRNGDILSYTLELYRLEGKSHLERARNTSVTKLILKDLSPETEYEVRVRSLTLQGAGPYSPRKWVKTISEFAPPPLEVKAMATSDSSVEVWWNEVRGDRVTGYRIYYSMTATDDLDKWQKLDVSVTTSADLENLESRTTFLIHVAARTRMGVLGRLSEQVQVRTDPTEVPMLLNAKDVSTRSMTIVWSPPRVLNPFRYKISYDAVKEFVDASGLTQRQVIPPVEVFVDRDVMEYTAKELIPFTTYTVNVSAVPRDGTRRPPAKLKVTTFMAAPRPMLKPDVYGVKGSVVYVALPKASEEYGPISHYFLLVIPEVEDKPYGHPDAYSMEDIQRNTHKFMRRDGSHDFWQDQSDLLPFIAAKFVEREIHRFFPLGDNKTYGGYWNRPLEKGQRYKIFLRAFVASSTQGSNLYGSSDMSDFISLDGPQVPPGPIPVNFAGSGFQGSGSLPGVTPTNRSRSSKVFSIILPLVIILILGLVGLFLWLKVRPHRMKGDFDPSVSKPLMSPAKDVYDMKAKQMGGGMGGSFQGSTTYMGGSGIDLPQTEDPVELRRLNFQTPGMMSHPPIPVMELASHIEQLKANDNLLFNQEYESIETGQQFTWENSNMEINKPKNRYANVIAYDHSRVVLTPIEGILGSDYVNANYCDGYRKQNAYIATQGPLPETFHDFWRMVWEQRSLTIVMMTKLEERARVKCDQYWPQKGNESYGDITVKLHDTLELATYTVRTFHLQKYGCMEIREVKHFMFTAWPDHGVPDHPTPFLMFLKRVKSCSPPDGGPIIVHCSAGVGRTGAFIVIDAMLERMKHEHTVDIYGHVTCLRAQRNYMVQTEDQYVFIHDALLEAVICGNTEVPALNLGMHIKSLLPYDGPEGTSNPMEKEFKRLSTVKNPPSCFATANLPCNKTKNRLVNILPYESSRVILHPLMDAEGSDYINASFIDGYRHRKAYIATQGPLPETAEDFWRMIWEQNSNIIVMLTKLREMGREKCHQYWPSDRCQRYMHYVVEPIAEYNMPQYILREFKVTDANEGLSRTVRHFQFTEWPEQGVPKQGEGFIDFIGQVHKTKDQFGHEGPITVHCSAGVGRTGVFITLSIVLERMQYEMVVDMFQTVRTLRTQRPGMVQTEDQYQFCYKAALEYLNSFDHYGS